MVPQVPSIKGFQAKEDEEEERIVQVKEHWKSICQGFPWSIYLVMKSKLIKGRVWSWVDMELSKVYMGWTLN